MKWMGRPVHFFLLFLAFIAKKVFKMPQKRSAKYRKKGFLNTTKKVLS